MMEKFSFYVSRNGNIISRKNIAKYILMDSLVIKKRIGGDGVLLVAYLVEYKGEKLILRIQKILPTDRKKNFLGDIWRAIDFQDFVKSRPAQDQRFFNITRKYQVTSALGYFDDVKLDISGTKDYIEHIKALQKSEWCLKWLTDDITNKNAQLQHFLAKKKLSRKQQYSLCLQICYILDVYYSGGYAPGLLSPNDLLIEKAAHTHFKWANTNIPHHGYQLKVAGCNGVMHKKFKNIKKSDADYWFIEDRKGWLFRDIQSSTFEIINNGSKLEADCIRKKKLLPYEYIFSVEEEALRRIIRNERDFYRAAKAKYIEKFPDGEHLMNLVESKISNKFLSYIVNGKKGSHDYYNIVNRILYEFHLRHPAKYSEYIHWCSSHKFTLPDNEVQEMLLINNSADYIAYLIEKIKEA